MSTKAYRDSHKDDTRRRNQEYCLSHADEISKQRAAYRESRRKLLAKKRRDWYLTNKDKQRAWDLKSRYGLTSDQVESMFLEQGGKCKLCGLPMLRPTREQKTANHSDGWHIDHDHATGIVRGLIHGKCNRGIGCFNHDPEKLRMAVEYLGDSRLAEPAPTVGIAHEQMPAMLAMIQMGESVEEKCDILERMLRNHGVQPSPPVDLSGVRDVHVTGVVHGGGPGPQIGRAWAPVDQLKPAMPAEDDPTMAKILPPDPPALGWDPFVNPPPAPGEEEREMEHYLDEWRGECSAPATLREVPCGGCTKDRQERCRAAFDAINALILTPKPSVTREWVKETVDEVFHLAGRLMDEEDDYLVGRLREIGVTVTEEEP